MLRRSEVGIAAINARFYAGVWARIGQEKEKAKMATNGSVYPKREKVEFPPNQPVRLALKYAQPKIGQSPSGDDYALYTTVDDRVMFLDCEVARQISQLGIRPSQPFNIMLRWSGKRADPKIYQVWLDPQNAPAPPSYGPQGDGTFAVPSAPPTPETDMERQLRESIALAGYRKTHPVNGNGANGLHSAAPQSGANQTTTSQAHHTPDPNTWAGQIFLRAQANIEVYMDLVGWAQNQYPGITKNEIRAWAMNAVIGYERSGSISR